MNPKKLLKPAFKNYFKALPDLITDSRPARSFGLTYEFADLGLVLLTQFFIPVVLYYLYQYSPFIFLRFTLFSIRNTIILGIALLAAYWLIFVYRFAAFKTGKDHNDWTHFLYPHEETAQPEEIKKPLLQRRIKSFFAFAALLAAVTGLMLAYCLAGRGQSVDRFYSSHKEQLNRLAVLVQKYETFDVDYINVAPYIYSGDTEIPEKEKEEITDILNRLSGSESYVFLIMGGKDMLQFSLADRWGENYELQWCPFAVPEPTGNEKYESFFKTSTDLKKIDEHWRYFKIHYSFLF